MGNSEGIEGEASLLAPISLGSYRFFLYQGKDLHIFGFICLVILFITINHRRRHSNLTKMKGVRKGFNKFVSQMFVKEDEIEIGCPTDVKHLAHIGFDGASGSNPSWMNKLETGPDFAVSSIGASSSSLQPLSSIDLESKERPSKKSGELVIEASSTEEVPPRHRKHRRKKNKSDASISPRAGGNVKTKSSTRKAKPKLVEGSGSPTILTMT